MSVSQERTLDQLTRGMRTDLIHHLKMALNSIDAAMSVAALGGDMKLAERLLNLQMLLRSEDRRLHL